MSVLLTPAKAEVSPGSVPSSLRAHVCARMSAETEGAVAEISKCKRLFLPLCQWFLACSAVQARRFSGGLTGL